VKFIKHSLIPIVDITWTLGGPDENIKCLPRQIWSTELSLSITGVSYILVFAPNRQ